MAHYIKIPRPLFIDDTTALKNIKRLFMGSGSNGIIFDVTKKGIKVNGYYKDYNEYWVKNTKNIKQQPRDSLSLYLEKLKNIGLINVNSKEYEEINVKVFDTNRKKINICPSIEMSYLIESNFAIELDKQRKSLDVLKEIIYKYKKER